MVLETGCSMVAHLGCIAAGLSTFFIHVHLPTLVGNHFLSLLIEM